MRLFIVGCETSICKSCIFFCFHIEMKNPGKKISNNNASLSIQEAPKPDSPPYQETQTNDIIILCLSSFTCKLIYLNTKKF